MTHVHDNAGYSGYSGYSKDRPTVLTVHLLQLGVAVCGCVARLAMYTRYKPVHRYSIIAGTLHASSKVHKHVRNESSPKLHP